MDNLFVTNDGSTKFQNGSMQTLLSQVPRQAFMRDEKTAYDCQYVLSLLIEGKKGVCRLKTELDGKVRQLDN